MDWKRFKKVLLSLFQNQDKNIYYERLKEIQKCFSHTLLPKEFIALQNDRKRFLKEVQHALQHNQFIVFYQPILRIDTEEIVALEALVRWKHPTYGLLNPGAFLPLIDESEYVVKLGEAVLRQACEQLKKWHEQGRRKLSITVNLFARQFMDERLVNLISEIITTTNILPSALQLEMTEATVMQDLAHSKIRMRQLVDLGVKLSIDDFGTGHSLLTHIKQLPISAIKIDRSFIANMMVEITSKAVIESVIVLCKSLGLAVIAEDVEDATQLRALKKMKCDMYQGYLFSPPVSPDEVVVLFTNRSYYSEEEIDLSNIRYEVMESQHAKQAIEVITESFCNYEPMTRYLGITAKEFIPFAELMVKKAIEEGLSIVALEGDKVVACTIVEDLAKPLDITIDIDPRFKIIFSLLEQLGNEFFHEKKILPGHIAHLFITAVTKEYHGKGISRSINFESIKIAKKKQFDFMCCEFTHDFNEKGTIKELKHNRVLIRSCVYKDFIYEDKKPFSTLEGGASAYIWELREGVKLQV